MRKTIDFIFDFGSPNAYLAHRVLPDLAARTGATVRYVPCLLGGIFKATGNQAPMMAYANVPAKLAHMKADTERFIRRHGLSEYRRNPHFPVNTLMLMRGAVAADLDGWLPAYVDAGFRCMWEQGLKMDDPVVFSQAMAQAGFDPAAMAERMASPEVKARLIRNTEDAVARGVFGIPSFFVGDEMYFGKERLSDVEADLTVTRSSSP